MPKRPRSPDSDDTTTAAAAAAPATYKTVFVNTNVDTHLALITSDSDTLSDLKDEIALEHGRLFPEMGEIKIHSLKVKRKGFFYYLPDYMLVKTAFEGVNKTWFLDVDISNKANKLLGSHVESEPQKDDKKTSSSIVRKSKQNRKGSQAPPSPSLPKCDAEFEKGGASSGKDHDHDMNCTEELNPLQQGLEKPVESTLPSASCETKEVNAHAKRSKRAKSSKSKFLDDQVDLVRNSTSVSLLVSPDTIDQEFPESAESVKRRLISGKHQVLPLNMTEERNLSAIHDPEIKGNEEHDSLHCKSTAHENSRKKKSKISRSGVQDEQVDRYKDSAAEFAAKVLQNCENTVTDNDSNMDQFPKNNLCSNSECADVLKVFQVNESNNTGEKEQSDPSALLVSKKVKTHDNSKKKRSKISRSEVLDEQLDCSKGTTAENDSNMEQVPENNLTSNSECADVSKAFEVNESNNVGEKKQSAPSASLVTKEAKTHDNSRKKKSKISRSGVQDEQVDRSKGTTAENDSNMEQEYPDVLKAFEVNESNNVGEKKQSVVPSASLVTKEAKTHDNSRKKKSKISSSGVQDEQVDRSKESTADFAATVQQNRESIVAENDSNVEQVPENNLTSNSECADVLEAIEVNESNNVGEKKQSVPSASLVTKEVKTHDNSRKKKAKISRSGVEDKQKGSTADFTATVQQNRESLVAENDSNVEQVPENNLTSKSECADVLKAVEVNESNNVGEKKQSSPSASLVTKEVKTHDNSRKKRSKISVSGAEDEQVDRSKDSTADFVAKVEQNQESIVAENDSNMEQVPESNLFSNSECPDVGKALKVNESSSNVGEKKQNTNKAVKDFEETVAMNGDADQINDIVSPSLDNPEQSDLARSSENDQIPRKVEESDLLVNNNSEEILLRDRPSDNDQNEPMIETFSNTNTSSATVAEEQKMGGSKEKKRTRKAVSVVCQDAMDTEKSETHTDIQVEKDVDHLLLSERIKASARKSSVPSEGKETPPVESSPNEVSAEVGTGKDHMQVEKDVDDLLLSKRIKASARKSSVSSRGKETPPVESSPNEVSAEVGTGKDGEVSECIEKETNVQKYHGDEDLRESIVGTIAKNNIEENIAPSVVSHQDLPQPSQKDHMVSSADQANNLTESKRVKNPKKKILKRGVPYAAASSDLDEIRTPHKPVSSAFSKGSDAAKTVTKTMEKVKSLAAPRVKSSSKTNEIRPLPDRKDSSLRHHATRGKNPSSKLNGQIEKKSSGTAPKAIFRDASSESSLDGNGSVDSSGSTRTPSDYSSSSSDSSEDENRKGLDDKDKGQSKKSIFNSEISSPMDIPLDTILKSSSRFRKARLTASQQLEDPDSQFDDLLE